MKHATPQPEYIEAACRNEPDLIRSHLYKKMPDGGLLPMCGYGWNRSNGERFSILRGWTGARGCCKTCIKRADKDLPPIADGWAHKTKWI